MSSVGSGFVSLWFLADEPALDRFRNAFEEGTLPRPDWTHAAHLAIGATYLVEYERFEAIWRARDGIRHYNASQGILNTSESGYHETITLFWLGITLNFLEKLPTEATRLERV